MVKLDYISNKSSWTTEYTSLSKRLKLDELQDDKRIFRSIRTDGAVVITVTSGTTGSFVHFSFETLFFSPSRSKAKKVHSSALFLVHRVVDKKETENFENIVLNDFRRQEGRFRYEVPLS
ncbi:hypothetical protein TNCV_2405751 [Trichonephila clavipes]|nr:hypothetical protein TNCV_2405751 [Trichonephila clavipes]